MDELQFATTQDKLLVMLLERVSNLEEQLEKNNLLMEKILSLTTFKYFSISLSGKPLSASTCENIEKYLLDYIKFIDEKIPLISAWVQDHSDNKSFCTLTIETSSKWLLCTINETLPNLHNNVKFPMNYNGGWTKSDTIWKYANLFAKKDFKTSQFVLA